MTDRFDVEHALRASASAPTPLPDPGFVDGLERRLVDEPLSGNVLPFARRARRVSAGIVIAASVGFAGVAAAAAGLVVTHQNDTASVPPPASTVVVTEAPTTTAAEPLPTLPITTPVTLPVTLPITTPRTEPITIPAVPVLTTILVELPPTTEVTLPATLTLSCAPTGGSVHCTWSAGPVGTGRYEVLRSDGRAFDVGGVTTWTDPLPPLGSTVTYLVHAMSFLPNSVSLAHSGSVTVHCC